MVEAWNAVELIEEQLVGWTKAFIQMLPNLHWRRSSWCSVRCWRGWGDP
ncbi:MAG: hypothetical protein R2811_08975 [Flavobacteriales bacterium]